MFPEAFAKTAIQQVSYIGLYRTNTEMIFLIDQNKIEIITKSRTIPLRKVTIGKPSASPPRGMSSINTTYVPERDTGAVEQPFNDIFAVEYARKPNAMRVKDTHAWWAPVTNFRVSFKYQDGIICRIERVLMPLTDGGNIPTPIYYDNTMTYIFPYPALSSQGFKWSVKWPSQAKPSESLTVV